jgi:hypothetical protein
MRSIIFSMLFSFCCQAVLAQDSTLTAEEKASLDSMFQNDEFLKLLNKKTDTSYIAVGIGVSNGVFSLKNNAINADQATTSKIFYTPSVAWYHKSGFGLSVNAFLASDSGKFKVFQYAVSPAYSYYSKRINWGISYTRYIKGSLGSFDINPYKNDLYGNISFKKPWFTPALAAGYSIGRSKEYFDSTYIITIGQQPPRPFRIKDTITSTLSSFSLNISVSHEWRFMHVFGKDDELDIQPYLSVNGSNQTLRITHSNSLNSRRPFVQKLIKTKTGDGKSKAAFSLQSAACLLTATYSKGRFVAEPQVYLDYYLQETNSNRFSALYSFVINYAF